MSTNLATFRRIWELSKDSPYMAKMEKPDLTFAGDNAVCGDWLELAFKLKRNSPPARGGARGGVRKTPHPTSPQRGEEKISEARFLHKGCAVSAVAASVFMEYAEGKTLADLQKITSEKQLKLFGAPVSPARIKCALLPLEILKQTQKKKDRAL